ncbi:hypothetical protein [uncultured Helcococcus sp.]|uniref:hypothetical protein n=1 Tax=uncultured Helcococcus sp. TaxID=1072508 RepID=UPI00288A9DE5|nr:hypothetical protein [uncultured Helcococcus sp.]
MNILLNIKNSIFSFIKRHPIITIFSIILLILFFDILNWRNGRTYYELKPSSPEGVKIVAVTKEIFYPNFESEIFIKYPDKKELVTANLKIGAKYKGIVSDDSNYTLQWNIDRTVTLTWDNIMFDKKIKRIINY